MPALFNLGACLALGAALGLCARRSESFRQAPVSWPLILVFGIHALVMAPAATYLFRFFPQWSMSYAFDPQVLPGLEDWVGALSGAVVVANLASSVAGLLFARYALLRGSALLPWTPFALWLASWILLFILYGDRALWIGTYDAYWHEDAALLFTSLPGVIGIGSYLLGIAFLSWVRARFRERDPSYL